MDKDNLELLKGKFITIEGVEGAGKSTQAKKLVNFLNENNIETIYTREPGGCEEAEEVRQILVNGSVNKLDGITELLLMYASRRILTEKKIKPTLKKNITVVSDRYFDSSLAYQGFGHNLDLNKVQNIRNLVLENFCPDLTIILDLPVEIGLQRANKRGATNRYEEMDIKFHKKTQEGFDYAFKTEPNRCKKIFVENKKEDEIFDEIILNIKNFFKKI